MLDEKPYVSIIIPTHNRPDLVVRAVASALAASGSYIEVIVVEDGSDVAVPALEKFSNDVRLVITKNAGARGAAATRNYGARISTGSVLLFLDDDDELIGDYVKRVREIASSQQVSWGFARQMIRTDLESETLQKYEVNANSTGRVADMTVPFRRKIAALSSGFWIRRSLFLDLGGLCVEQVVDEDTDLCCRLLGAGYEPWLENRYAVLLDRTSGVARLTTQADKNTNAECYLRTFLRNIASCEHIWGASAYLAFRAQRMILRSGQTDMLNQVTRNVKKPWLRFGLSFKRVLFRWRRPQSRSA